MNTTPVAASTAPAHRTHPLILVAAAAVTIASLTAVASLAGWLPGGSSADAPAAQLAANEAAAPEAPAAAPAEKSSASENAGSASRRTAEAPARQSTAPRHQAQRAATPAPVETADSTPARSIRRGATPVSDSGIVVEDRRPAAARCVDCGTIENVREVSRPGEPSALGTIAGGVVGGLLGNQVGKGSGRTVATVVGAVGGGFAGREVEKNVRSLREYEITVRFENGGSRVFSQSQPPAWRNGDRVRIENDQIVAR